MFLGFFVTHQTAAERKSSYFLESDKKLLFLRMLPVFAFPLH